MSGQIDGWLLGTDGVGVVMVTAYFTWVLNLYSGAAHAGGTVLSISISIENNVPTRHSKRYTCSGRSYSYQTDIHYLFVSEPVP